MASFKIARGLSTKLPTTKVDGAIYFCTDTHELYIDYKNSNNTIVRVGINASQLEGATLAQELKNSTSEIPSSALISSIKSALENSIAGVSSSLSTHTANKSNPHGVTKSQVGLGNVNNTSDANKPVSTAQATAIANAKTEALNASSAVSEALSAHTSNKNNPHGVTLSQLGAQATITGAASTVTDSNLTASRVLVSNSSGKIAASSSITTTELGYLDGVTSKIQTQLDSKASSEALLAHIADTDNPHSVTKAQIGLGDVENKSSATIRDELTKSNVTTALGYTPPTTDTATTTSDGLMSKEEKIKLDYTNIAYGTCATAARTAAKVVTLTGNDNWELKVGSVIVVKFTYTNSAASPTLNVNNTGAKSIWYDTSVYTSSSSYGGYAKRHIIYVFDGTYWVFIGWGYDSNTDTKVTQSFTTADGNYPVVLAYTTSTTSETANAVKKNLDFVYNPSSSTLTVPNIIGDLDGKATKDGEGNVIVDTYETKNDAINKLNAATAHADQVSEAVSQSLASHTSNSTIHITSAERTNWNAAKTHADSAHAPSDAEKNVQADWSITDTSSDAYIKNKPTSMTPTSHAHGNITNSGTITSTAVTAATGILVYDSNNKIQRATAANARSIIGAGTSSLALGTTSSTAYRGDYGNTAYTHSQSAHAPSNAEKNQNAFSNVKVGSTTITADTATDTLELVAGSNITLTPDATNDKITIAATDTTYTALKNPNSLTVQGNGTTSFSYDGSAAKTLNIKPGSNVSVSSDTSGNITINATNTTYNVVSTSADGLAPKRDGSTTKFLRGDGTWAVPPDNNTTYSNATTSAAGLMSSTDKSKMNYTNIAYGTCSTAAATAAKVITVSGNTNWILTAGSIITIKFSETNTASNPTFNVNGTGAKSVGYGNGATLTTSSLSMAGYKDRPMMYMYDGSKFVFISWSYDANTTYTNASLGQGCGTCSTAAATAEKVVTLSNYALVTGGIVFVKFTYAVPANATMNINSKGAKDIYHRGAKITANVIQAGDIATFIYDGTRYQLMSIDNNFSTMTSNLTISKSSPYLYLKNTSTARTARMASTSDKYLSLYNEVTADASNNRTALWLGPETNTVKGLLQINHISNGTANTYTVLHTGNSNRTTLVSTATTPTVNNEINWVYE